MPNGVIWAGAVDGSNHVGAMVTCQAMTASPVGVCAAARGTIARKKETAASRPARRCDRIRRSTSLSLRPSIRHLRSGSAGSLRDEIAALVVAAQAGGRGDFGPSPGEGAARHPGGAGYYVLIARA